MKRRWVAFAAIGCLVALGIVAAGQRPSTPRSQSALPQVSDSASSTTIATESPAPTSVPSFDATPLALSPGSHTTAEFAVPFTYEVSEGWALPTDSTTAFGLAWIEAGGLEGGGIAGFELVHDVYPVEFDNAGSQTITPDSWSKPHAVRDLLRELETRACFDTTSEPTSVGGRSAWSVLVAVHTDCEATPLYVVHWSDGVPLTHGTGPGAVESFTLIEADGRTMLLSTRGVADGTASVAIASVIRTIEFIPTVGPLDAGTYSTALFDLPFRFTVPAGWSIDTDRDESFSLSVRDDETASVSLFYKVYSAGCGQPNISRRQRPEDLVRSFEGLRNFVTTAETISLGGLSGLSGNLIDSGVASCAPVLAVLSPTAGMRLLNISAGPYVALDDGVGGTLLITIVGGDAAFAAEAKDVVASVVFEP